MKGPGIFWMLQTAAGMSMAGPIFVVGFEFVRTGRYVAGIGFLALGAVTLYFPTYLINRIGGPRTWLRRRFESAGNATGDDDGGATRETGSGSRGAGLLDRLRDR